MVYTVDIHATNIEHKSMEATMASALVEKTTEEPRQRQYDGRYREGVGVGTGRQGIPYDTQSDQEAHEEEIRRSGEVHRDRFGSRQLLLGEAFWPFPLCSFS